MSKNIAAAVAAIIISVAALSANAAIVQTPPKRSAMQEECIKENPQDHGGYLNCIRTKKAEKKNAQKNGSSMTVPASAPVTDPNQNPARQ
jgi:hypothetical protein